MYAVCRQALGGASVGLPTSAGQTALSVPAAGSLVPLWVCAGSGSAVGRIWLCCHSELYVVSFLHRVVQWLKPLQLKHSLP